MELEGTVHDGVVVLDDSSALPEGTRVRIIATPDVVRKSFGERYSRFKGAAVNLPPDLATAGNISALIAAMEAEPRLSTEDVAELREAIVANKRPAAPIDPFGRDSGLA